MKALSKIGMFLALVCFMANVAAEEEVEFSLEIAESSNVQIDGEGAGAGDVVNQDNVGEVVFGEGASMLVRNKKTGILYRVNSAADLAFLGNALGTNTNGVVIGRWVVGGGVASNERSTLLALKERLGVNVGDQVNNNPNNAPAATPVGP